MTIITQPAALLVDGDNIPPALIGSAFTAAAKIGTLTVRRVHVHPQHLPAWSAVTGFRVVASASGKNATDIALTIDAVDLAAREGTRSLAIASSDRDFSALALYLRERGCHVLGIGEAKAPRAFRAACTAFQEIRRPPSPEDRLSDTDRSLREIIRTHGNGVGLRMVSAGSLLFKHKGIKAGDLPGGNLRGYMTGHTALYDLDPKGPEANVRWIGPVA